LDYGSDLPFAHSLAGRLDMLCSQVVEVASQAPTSSLQQIALFLRLETQPARQFEL
jgi:hypothetical protein